MWTPWSHCVCPLNEFVLLIYTLSPCKILNERPTSNEKEFLFQEDGRVFMLDVTQICLFFYEAAPLTEFTNRNLACKNALFGHVVLNSIKAYILLCHQQSVKAVTKKILPINVSQTQNTQSCFQFLPVASRGIAAKKLQSLTSV